MKRLILGLCLFLIAAPVSEALGATANVSRVEALKARCDSGDAFSCLRVAKHYESGAGGRRDPDQAALYFTVACRGRDRGACAQINALYKAGRGIRQDYMDIVWSSMKCMDGDQSGCRRAAAYRLPVGPSPDASISGSALRNENHSAEPASAGEAAALVAEFNRAVSCHAAAQYIVEAHTDLPAFRGALDRSRQDAFRLGAAFGLSIKEVENELKTYFDAHSGAYYASDSAADDQPMMGDVLEDAKQCRDGGYLS